ncbi:MAG: zf-HC2 domain-containing protein [Phycisphaerae bacterium]
MRCEQAQQLFDAYLNGELSPALTTELGAHRVRCPECRRALALLEVSGHVVASDRDPVALDGDFTDRLVACVESPGAKRIHALRRAPYIIGPLAAAAVIALAFLGVFDRSPGEWAGEKTVWPDAKRPNVEEVRSAADLTVEETLPDADYRNERLLEAWVEQMQENMAAKRESGESLQKAFGLTIRQLLDTLKEADEASDQGDDASGDDVTVPLARPEAAPTGSDDVEDL